MAVRAIVIQDPADVRAVHHAAEDNIVGYGIPSTRHEAARRAHLTQLFVEEPAQTPEPTIAIAGVDEDTSRLVAGAILETSQTSEITNLNAARSLAQAHRVLAALFVIEPYRRTRLGRDLLCEAAARAALGSGARYIDGFVDDRNAAVGFYRRIGAHVLPKDEALPARSPSNVTQLPRPGISGHWFYLDLWDLFSGRLTCLRCDTPLDYSPNDDRLHCSRCGPPPASTDPT